MCVGITVQKLIWGVAVAAGIGGFLGGTASSAYAFHIEDHLNITRQAIREFAQCVPDAATWLTSDFSTTLLRSNMDEDLNLLRKWTYYSHYYNPDKHVKMDRRDSSATIQEVEANLQAGKHDQSRNGVTNVALWLGRAAHHVQDMFVPAHVVPIEHGYEDGFEDYSVTVPGPDTAAILVPDCSWAIPGAPSSLLALHHDAAVFSLHALATDPVFMLKDGLPFPTTWGSAFWAESTDDSFGIYGNLANHFGETSFVTDDEHRYEVSAETFLKYKSDRMRQAVVATRMVLLWWEHRVTEVRQGY